MLQKTKNAGQKVIIIIPPARQDYKNLLPNFEILFKKLFEVAKNFPHAKILNFYTTDELTTEDFQDADHLNKSGAEKLTEKIRKYIN